MMTNKEIAKAARRLADSNLRDLIEQARGSSGDEAHRALPVIQPHMDDILTLIDAADVIANVFRGLHESEYQDYDPGPLDAGLCRRFSELPQYAEASKAVKRVVGGLGYADVIGIFLAKDPERFNFANPGVGPKTWQEFVDWIEKVLEEEGITRDKAALAAFEKYATLATLMRRATGTDSFHWFSKCPDELTDEPIRPTDCKRLLEMGIRTTPDLAQTSVQELKQIFLNDKFAMDRLHAFLTKRGLEFGTKFLPRWG